MPAVSTSRSAAAVDLELGVDRVARRAGDVGDDHALAAEERVDERGLADVRAADHREPDEVLLLGPPPPRAGAARRAGRAGRPCRAPGRRRPASARRGRGRGSRARAGCRAASRSCWPRARRARPPRRRMSATSSSPGRRPARASTTSSATCGVGQRGARLVLDRDGERVLVVEVDAAGVDQRERAPVPVRLELLAVARDARALVHDRLARLREPVDERGLADVRVADDGDLHASISLASTTSVRIWSSTPSRSSSVVSTGTASFAGDQRRVLAPLVALVALDARASTVLDVGAQLLGAAPRPLLGRRR